MFIRNNLVIGGGQKKKKKKKAVNDKRSREINHNGQMGNKGKKGKIPSHQSNRLALNCQGRTWVITEMRATGLF